MRGVDMGERAGKGDDNPGEWASEGDDNTGVKADGRLQELSMIITSLLSVLFFSDWRK